MRRGALVLAGGRSRRMGRDKATLPFGPETLLERVLRLLRGVVDEIQVVSRPGQALPPLPPGVHLLHDDVLDRGPLGGLVPGLAASDADGVFATACDVPFVRPEVVDLLFARLGDADAVVVEAEGRVHPLTAVYRPRVLPVARRLLAAGRLRPLFLLEEVETVRVTEAELRAVDPDLDALRNLNTEEDLREALDRLRLVGSPGGPSVTVELYERARQLAGRASVTVEASTLGEALLALGRVVPELEGPVVAGGRLAPHWRASVGGRTFVDDPSTPLPPGATVLLVSALGGG